MLLPNCLLQVTATTAQSPHPGWSITVLPPALSALAAIANLLLAATVFRYTKQKNTADIKIKWFLELIYSPHKESFKAYFANLHDLKSHVPTDGNWTEDQRIGAIAYVNQEDTKFRQEFASILESTAPSIHKRVIGIVDSMTVVLTQALDNDELKLQNSKTYAREIQAPITRAKGQIIAAIFEYKG